MNLSIEYFDVFIYIKNNEGPIIDPCGTSQVIGKIVEGWLLIIVFCVLSCK